MTGKVEASPASVTIRVGDDIAVTVSPDRSSPHLLIARGLRLNGPMIMGPP